MTREERRQQEAADTQTGHTHLPEITILSGAHTHTLVWDFSNYIFCLSFVLNCLSRFSIKQSNLTVFPQILPSSPGHGKQGQRQGGRDGRGVDPHTQRWLNPVTHSFPFTSSLPRAFYSNRRLFKFTEKRMGRTPKLRGKKVYRYFLLESGHRTSLLKPVVESAILLELRLQADGTISGIVYSSRTFY